MTTHELAFMLLKGPNEPVFVRKDATLEQVDAVEVLTIGEWTHQGQVVTQDANGALLPEDYSVIVGKTGAV